MKSETKSCQNCRQEFRIEPEDFDFYKKIDVSPPTFCSDCRLVRRLLWRNERALYKRKCDLCDKEKISVYPPEATFPVYCNDCWFSDDWNSLEYGQAYDFSKPFFAQFEKLINKVPRLGLAHFRSVNSPHGNFSLGNKNSYLLFASSYNEDSMYSRWILNSRDLIECLNALSCEDSYGLIDCLRVSHSVLVSKSQDSFNMLLCSDCRGCHDCFGCVGLRGKEHHIFNKPYAKEEYVERVGKLKRAVASFSGLADLTEQFRDLYRTIPKKYAEVLKSVNCSGDYLTNSKNVKHSFNVEKAEDCAYILDGLEIKDSYDISFQAYNSELDYEIMSTENSSRCRCSITLVDCFNVDYSWLCMSSSKLFGCMAARHKQHCILNKQYSEEEYEKLVPKIIEHMEKVPYLDKKSREYKNGEFFPPDLSPFAYSETLAQEYFPLTRKQAEEQGYRWKELEDRHYEITLLSDDLPDRIDDVDESILGEVIGCEHKGKCKEQCATAFKMIPQELKLYKKFGLPLPRLCPNCRHYQRLKLRNPLKLWYRKCQCAGAGSESDVYENTVEHFHKNEHCPNKFETTYSPERSEIVYCEQCYNAEVA